MQCAGKVVLATGAQLLAALSVGSEIVQLSDRARRLGLNADLDPALVAVAQGDTATTTARSPGWMRH